MTITMTSKNQITIPKKIVNALDLNKGAMFDIKIAGHRIELVPVETVEKVFTDEEYDRLNELCQCKSKMSGFSQIKNVSKVNHVVNG
ncbi:MAG: AbrB/MazE/SpoVT family DNA-binding domain-containing protein [Candidatus Anammoxibacter sp.]